MRKSDYDNRQYKYLTLANGLRIFLVHDQLCSKNAVSITINSGHFNDPVECQGLSHLLEHTLFLGNRANPEVNGLLNYLSHVGGSINAQTGTEYTSYYMDLPEAALSQSLAQLYAMLTTPLITAEAVNHEIEAIEAEFQMKKRDELRRLYQVHKETCYDKHPFSKFSVGNRDIFKQFTTEKLCSMLTQLHQTYYQPANTTVCVITSQAIDVAEKQVTELFSNWQTSLPRTINTFPPLYLPEHLGLKINIRPLQTSHRLIVTFALPNLDAHFRSKPLSILSHVIGDEGEGSLLDCIKTKNWGTNLNAGGGIEGKNFKDFNINIQLTEKGLENTDKIIALVMDYVEHLKTEGIQVWQMKEIAAINQIQWDFADRPKAVEEALHLSQSMFEYEEEFLLVGDYILDRIKPELIQSILEQFCFENMRVKVVSPAVTSNLNAKWYDTPYQVEKLPSYLKHQVIRPRNEFSLPTSNSFLFRPQPLKAVDTSYKLPRLIIEQRGLNIWYGQDSKFNQPKGDCFLTFDCEAVTQGIKVTAAKRFWIALLNEKLNPRYYQANLAGMHFHFYPHQAGFSLQTNGFSQNQLMFYTKLLTQVVVREDFEASFSHMKKRQQQSLHNRLLNKPINRLFSRLAVLMQAHNYLAEDLSETIDRLTLDDIYKTKHQLLNKFHLEGLMYGDWTIQDATDISHTIKDFRGQYPIGDEVKRPVADIKQESILLHQVDCLHKDNAVVVYFQSNDMSLETTTLTILTEQLIASPFFNALRNEQQLGYLVGTGYVPYNQIPGIALYVQSPKASVQELIIAMHVFLEKMVENIEKHSKFWNSIKKGLIKQVSEKDTSLSMRSQRLWLAIGNKDHNFSHAEKMINIIHSISIIEIKNFIVDLLNQQNSGEIILYSGKFDNLNTLKNTQHIDNPRHFKQNTRYI